MKRHRDRGLVLLLFIGGLLSAFPATLLAADVYVKKATWPETMIATRAKLIEDRAKQSPVELGPWFTTGPLPAKEFKEALFPEKGIDLKAKGPDGKPLWQEKPEWTDGRRHDLKNTNRVTTYLTRTIKTTEATALPVGFGSDDGIEVWLNRKKILSVDRGVGDNQEKRNLELKPGDNQLLLKVFNSGGGHSFYFGVGEQKEEDTVAEIWKQMEKDFPVGARWMRERLGGNRYLGWFEKAGEVAMEKEIIAHAIRDLGRDGGRFQARLDALVKEEAPADDPRWLALCEKARLYRMLPNEIRQVNVPALRMAVEDLIETYGDKYRNGEAYLKEIENFENRVADITTAIAAGDNNAKGAIPGLIERFKHLQQEALLANPLLDFEGLLLVKRSVKSRKLGLPQNWQGNCAVGKNGYDNEIDVLSPINPKGELHTLYRPEKGSNFVGDVDLHFDADRMLFSMPGSNNRWQIWEVGINGKNLRQVTKGEYADVDNYDACYLPDGRIIFASTRCFHGIPCVGGGNTVANLCLMDNRGENIRQLCFDQDHNWCPTVLNNGQILYSRWEYSDTPHYFSRLLFRMNPDGTGQMEYYGSNSFWPNSTFYARPIPGHPTQVIGVISGHHGVPRMGELILFDPAEGRQEADGAVQRIPGHGQKVDPRIQDGLVNGSWPKFLHPFPLSGKYFLVSMQPTNSSLWGIYLVDVFDNMVLVREEPGYALFEPVPLRETKRPPIIPDKVNLNTKEAVVYMSDVYFGPGLAGVPRGTVKKLRVYEPHYAYPRMGGHINIGIDGPWDAKRILGTVPVEPDGSASFRVPANTPLAVQPLDADGKALQIMRSWFTAMPGEVLSCIGCHEKQNSVPPSRATLAATRPPSRIEPWYGPVRGFSFTRELQPVLDRYCVGCHDGKENGRPNFARDRKSNFRNFTPSYIALHPYVRRPGPESDYHLQVPLEFHAGTSELIQMLEKGHHNVKLDREAWDRLITWIDLNVPDKGTWHEHRSIANEYDKRRAEMRKRYAGIDIMPEEIEPVDEKPAEFVQPEPLPERKRPDLKVTGWPFDAGEARRRQMEAGGLEPERKIEFGEDAAMELMLIPAGEFVMGGHNGVADEHPVAKVRIEKPFYMGTFEVTNQQYALFDPSHNSEYISVLNKDQGNRGEAANREQQPVIRVSWNRAMAFCDWLSKRTGRKFTLPTEAQWEYACRAGTNSPLYFGDCNTDFGKFANLADQRVHNLCRRDSPKWIPNVPKVNDGSIISDHVGKYEPNAWGLRDMHGNVAEWTRTAYRPYPYDPGDGREDPKASGARSVRGGSWYDRPKRARSAFRMHYPPWQRVYNVGFRVVMEAE